MTARCCEGSPAPVHHRNWQSNNVPYVASLICQTLPCPLPFPQNVAAAAGSLMKCDKRTQDNITEKKNTVEKIHKTQSINVREQQRRRSPSGEGLSGSGREAGS